MKATVRATAPSDAAAIVALLRDVFGLAENHPALDDKQLQWKYWLDRPEWPGSRSFVLERGGQLLAHAAVVPGACVWRGGRFRTAHLIDWAARRSAVGAGTALLKHIGRLTDALIAIGGSAETRAILPSLGFRAYGEATGFARSLRPFKRAALGAQPPARRAIQLTRAVIWRIAAPLRRPAGWSTRPMLTDEIDSFHRDFPGPSNGPAMLEHTRDQFRYLLACPAAPTKLYAARKENSAVAGYFLLTVAPSQARLAAFGLNSDDAADWRSLFDLASERALEDPACAELVTLTSEAAAARALGRCGFHARRREPIHLLATSVPALPDTDLSVQMIDNDAFCYRGGNPEYWC
jgi:hypothetical protein